MKNENLLEVMRRGLLEIRSLTSGGASDNRDRIHALANILHNIPRAIVQDDQSFDQKLLLGELLKYEQNFGMSGIGLSESLKQ